MNTIKKHKVLFICLAVLLVAGGITGGVLAYQAAIAPPPEWVEVDEQAVERRYREGVLMEFDALTVDTEEETVEASFKVTNNTEGDVNWGYGAWIVDYCYRGKWYTIYEPKTMEKGIHTMAGGPLLLRGATGILSYTFPYEYIHKKGLYRFVLKYSACCEVEVPADL